MFFVAIVFLVLGWFLTNTFTPKFPDIKSDTTYKKNDTGKFNMPKPIIKYIDTGKIIYRDTGRLVLIPVPRNSVSRDDSAKIFKAFFLKNKDTATIVNDSKLWLRLNYEITQNKLISGTGQYLIKEPIQIINNNPQPVLKNQLYIGVGTGTDFFSAFKIEGRITLKTRKDNLWGFKVEKISNIPKPVYSVSHDFKISFKK